MSGKPILVVDIDGTLIKTDLLYESFWSALSDNAGTAISTLRSLLIGKAFVKAHLAERVEIDAARLPYNNEVLDLVRAWRADGGRTALVTACDQKFAKAISDHLGLFDEVYSSDGVRNLKGSAKADFLVEKFGDGCFDYVGDARADLPVWQRARRAITAGVPPALRRAVEAVSSDVQHLKTERKKWAAYARALRPHQWLKNILIFLPVIAAHDVSAGTWLAAVLAFIAFSLVASGVYVLNDLLDLGADRAHPRKHKRPLASGEVPLAHGTLMVPALLLLGAAFALAVGRWEFFGVILAYGLATTAYSLTLKRMLILDICALAVLYTTRILAGGVATGIPLSVWLLAFSIFFFLALAAVKRQAELVDGLQTGRERATRRAYYVDDLPIVAMMAIASGYVAVLVLALYINTPAVQELYNRPSLLWGVCLVLLYWISRMAMIAHRGHMDDDPIVFAVRDRASQICGLLIAGIVAAGSLT
jgi:4-hydroxybenzoate polyprenyltransferase/phosphoserine phosphatase